MVLGGLLLTLAASGACGAPPSDSGLAEAPDPQGKRDLHPVSSWQEPDLKTGAGMTEDGTSRDLMVAQPEPVGDSPVPEPALIDQPACAATEPSPAARCGGWTLDALIAVAAQSNPRVRSQEQASSSAQYDVAAARWQHFPTPSVQGDGGLGDRQVVASLSQPIWSFGRIESDIQVARARADNAEAKVSEARYGIAIRVLDAFSQLAAAKRQIMAYQADLARLMVLEAMISRRVAAGVSAPVDHNLIMSRIGQTRSMLVGLYARQRSAAQALSQLVDSEVEPDQVLLPLSDSGPGTFGPFLEELAGREALVARSLDSNPGIRRAGYDVAVAQAEARRAKASLWPTLYAKVEHRANTGGYTSALPDTMFALGFQVSLGPGLSAGDRVKASEAQESATRLALQAARADLKASVAADFESWTSARQLVASLRENRRIQAETAESYQRMFLAGKRSWLDLLNVTREQTLVDKDLGDAEVQLVVSAYRLRIQTGEIQWR